MRTILSTLALLIAVPVVALAERIPVVLPGDGFAELASDRQYGCYVDESGYTYPGQFEHVPAERLKYFELWSPAQLSQMVKDSKKLLGKLKIKKLKAKSQGRTKRFRKLKEARASELSRYKSLKELGPFCTQTGTLGRPLQPRPAEQFVSVTDPSPAYPWPLDVYGLYTRTGDLQDQFGAVYFVSNSGDDSANGLTVSTAFRTVEMAYSHVRDRSSDQVLLERGGVWSSFPVWSKSGLNQELPIVVGSYGDKNLPRPVLQSGLQFLNTGGQLGNLAFTDLDIACPGGGTAIEARNVQLLRVLFENMRIRGCGLALNAVSPLARFDPNTGVDLTQSSQLFFRRNIVIDAVGNSARGLKLQRVNSPQIAANVFDKASTLGASVVYLDSVGGANIQGNVFTRSAGYAVEARYGGLVSLRENVGAEQAGLILGTGAPFGIGQQPISIIANQNVLTDAVRRSELDPITFLQTERGVRGVWIENPGAVDISSNIFARTKRDPLFLDPEQGDLAIRYGGALDYASVAIYSNRIIDYGSLVSSGSVRGGTQVSEAINDNTLINTNPIRPSLWLAADRERLVGQSRPLFVRNKIFAPNDAQPFMLEEIGTASLGIGCVITTDRQHAINSTNFYVTSRLFLGDHSFNISRVLDASSFLLSNCSNAASSAPFRVGKRVDPTFWDAIATPVDQVFLTSLPFSNDPNRTLGQIGQFLGLSDGSLESTMALLRAGDRPLYEQYPQLQGSFIRAYLANGLMLQ